MTAENGGINQPKIIGGCASSRRVVIFINANTSADISSGKAAGSLYRKWPLAYRKKTSIAKYNQRGEENESLLSLQ